MEEKARKQLIKQLEEKHQQDQKVANGKTRSMFIRHLDCGSCNACELELIALSNPLYDLGRWGVRFEASPRHADVLALTGPYVRGLDEAARKTLEAMPVPRVITIGDCPGKVSPFENAYGVMPLPEEISKAVIAHVSGCPPSPDQIRQVLVQISLEDSAGSS